MKKLIFAILSLGVLFLSNASADGFCQNWEHGDIVNMPGANQPNGSTAPKPFCWQVSDLAGVVNFQGGWYLINPEDPLPIQGRNDSYYNFYGYHVDYAYGEMHRGIYIFAEVYGYPQNTPKVTFNNLPGVLKSTDNILSLSGNIINGTRYKFFMPIEEYTDDPYNPYSNEAYGTVRIFDGLDLKRTFTIF